MALENKSVLSLGLNHPLVQVNYLKIQVAIKMIVAVKGIRIRVGMQMMP
uniref:Uncharacterized protein n=1 Tax=Candidatus Kentrum sp. LPFa TaxID=2126335 RepID=A0A450XKE6_9GAMM|nr:MAG: hypothetical protein BECKLPF1236A_GA0070988_100939 [Candidatus Kentron sp. LPFa]VFK29782.1 MAG: hypothetical protein BECKLPF1236C_GA0070990_100953 [Candidatus Kentron sp. LPFa]